MFENLFKLSENGTTIRIEVMAGLTTFLTMAYIIIVNPDIMSTTGMDKGALFVATCLAAAVGCFIMGFFANYPIALAPGLGLNAFFAFGVVGGMGVPWQTALGVIFLSGVFFLIITILPIRAWIINAIPKSLKMSISAGIGLFIGVIALEIAGITVDHPATLVTLGEVTSIEVILVAVGFVAIVALDRIGMKGAIVIGIVGTTVLAHIFGAASGTAMNFTIPSLAPTFLQLDIASAFQVSMISVIIAFLFVDMFDTAGTLIGVSHRAGLLDEDGKLPRMGKALSADSIATITGSLVGSSTVTSYIESAAGVREGGRTGLTAVTVGISVRSGAHSGSGHRTGSSVCNGPGPAFRGSSYGAWPDRARLGRCDGICPGGSCRGGHAVHLLDRPWHRIRFHHLCGRQGSFGTVQRSQPGCLYPRNRIWTALRLWPDRLAKPTNSIDAGRGFPGPFSYQVTCIHGGSSFATFLNMGQFS